MPKSNKWDNDWLFKRMFYESRVGLLESFPVELSYSQENIIVRGIPEIPLRPDNAGIYHVVSA